MSVSFQGLGRTLMPKFNNLCLAHVLSLLKRLLPFVKLRKYSSSSSSSGVRRVRAVPLGRVQGRSFRAQPDFSSCLCEEPRLKFSIQKSCKSQFMIPSSTDRYKHPRQLGPKGLNSPSQRSDPLPTTLIYLIYTLCRNPKP